ncbi:hypothetical protein HYDPIDRAFT_109806 [Hydnomerulius pinastri MD-312]|nr:hypothetical protein HYDPIDRAFT_109806 [Hydnomerulius pinastri MD-312]
MSEPSLTEKSRALRAAKNKTGGATPAPPSEHAAPGNSELPTTGRPSRKTKAEARSVWMRAVPLSRKRAATEMPASASEDAAKPLKKKKASSATTISQHEVQDLSGGAARERDSSSHQLPLKPKIARKVITAALQAAGVPVDEHSDGEPISGSEFELDDNASDDDGQSGDDDGLGNQNGNPAQLRAALFAERPQVCGATGAATASARSSSRQSKATQPRSAASVRDAEESDPESDTEHLIMAPLHASVSKRRVLPSAPTPSVSLSAREKHRRAEIPVWSQEPTPANNVLGPVTVASANADSSAAAMQGHEGGNDADVSEPRRTDPAQTVIPAPQWTPNTHITLNARGQVNIRDQQPHIQAMLRTSISLALHHIAFEDPYPDMNHTRRTVADILYMAADQTAGCDGVRARLAQDTQYVRALSSVPSGRISKARTAVKVVAQRHVASVYQLEKGCGAEKIDVLLQKNTFIFPVDSHGNPIRSKPFQSPAIIRTIQDAFFHDDLSAGIRHASSFVSTSQSLPDELELPPSMVALATTAVRAVIMDFLSDAAAEFNSTVFCGIYERLVEFINALHRGSNRKCHVLMALLYKLASGAKKKLADVESGEMMLMHIDLDAMAEE